MGESPSTDQPQTSSVPAPCPLPAEMLVKVSAASERTGHTTPDTDGHTTTWPITSPVSAAPASSQPNGSTDTSSMMNANRGTMVCVPTDSHRSSTVVRVPSLCATSAVTRPLLTATSVTVVSWTKLLDRTPPVVPSSSPTAPESGTTSTVTLPTTLPSAATSTPSPTTAHPSAVATTRPPSGSPR